MRLGVQRRLHAGRAGPLARALARGTAWIAARRARVPRPDAPAVPTIVVGALSIGGAGKTPVVEWLARALAPRARVAIIGHGYGAAIDRPVRVEAPDAARFGDEAAALRRALPPEVIIALGPSRAAAHAFVAPEADVILVDDGFQDPRLPRTADLVVIDATAARGVLPAGPLREPLAALARADRVWLHKVDEPGARPLPAPWSPLVHSRVEATAVRLPDGRRVPPDWLAGRAVRPICAIGRPASFLHRLRHHGARLDAGCVRADHHRFAAAELARLPADLPWITTAKDRERLPPDWPAAVLETTLRIEAGADALDRWLATVASGRAR